MQHAGDEYVARAAVADHVDGVQDLAHAAGLAAGQEVELEVVRGDDVGPRDDGVAHELGDPGPHEHPAPDVAHHRVAAVDRVRVELLDPLDRVEDDRADGRVALVARQHGVGLAEHPAVLDARDHLGHVAGGQQRAAPLAVPGVVGEVHREHRPDLVAEPLEREDGSGVADVAVRDRGLDGQDLHPADPREAGLYEQTRTRYSYRRVWAPPRPEERELEVRHGQGQSQGQRGRLRRRGVGERGQRPRRAAGRGREERDPARGGQERRAVPGEEARDDRPDALGPRDQEEGRLGLLHDARRSTRSTGGSRRPAARWSAARARSTAWSTSAATAPTTTRGRPRATPAGPPTR